MIIDVWKRLSIAVLSISLTSLFAQQGIIVACNDQYAQYLVPSLAYLRESLNCTLPIEVWHAGDELSDKTKQRLSKFQPISFHDIEEALGSFDTNYRGFQIKPYMLRVTQFDEVLLMDADVYFHKDPSCLFDTTEYKTTGAYFFRDLRSWRYVRTSSLENYIKRRAFFRSLISSPSTHVPPEWSHYWTTNQYPSAQNPFLEAHQESGCVAIDRKRHLLGIETIIELNRNRAVTYTFVHGDKETFWLGLEMSQEPFSINPTYPMSLSTGKMHIKVVHHFNNELFFHQKSPIQANNNSIFRDENLKRRLTPHEINQMNRCYLVYQQNRYYF